MIPSADKRRKEETVKRYCENCRFCDASLSEYPCCECNSKWSKWEPIEGMKEDDMENENTTVKINTEAELKAQVAKVQELDRKVKEQEIVIRELERTNVRQDGEIRGLKFAIRCNGVSGGEV